MSRKTMSRKISETLRLRYHENPHPFAKNAKGWGSLNRGGDQKNQIKGGRARPHGNPLEFAVKDCDQRLTFT